MSSTGTTTPPTPYSTLRKMPSILRRRRFVNSALTVLGDDFLEDLTDRSGHSVEGVSYYCD